MFVHIMGPNLRDQSRGDFHIHAEGCQDVKRSPEYAGAEFEWDRRYTHSVCSIEDISAWIYSDMISSGEMTAEDGIDTFYVFPCAAGLRKV